ncbi:hypothetical protein HYALB_00005836 [Hymenoscyphus albidus]|uniref:BTB domain-containing protein n=1 Tax=Hymenoscyphus albidus TaxID=595503 RepID=A0A9N9QB50_9HELO|nr:hypothetical protein HYALB_00005836 [Hymenoscyphus albidus]
MKRVARSLTVDGPATKKVKTEPSEVTPVPAALEASSLRGHHSFKAPGDMITLIIGDGDAQRSFFVHRDILCRQSRFFQHASSKDQCIKLPKDDPEVIQAMVYWMYEEKVCIPQISIDHGLDLREINNDNVMGTAWGLFVKLFLLAEKFQIAALEYAAMKAFVHRWNEGSSEPNHAQRLVTLRVAMHVVSYVYNHTRSSESPLRHMLLRLIVADLSASVDYLSLLRAQVRPSSFADITYELAKLHSDIGSEVDIEDGWVTFLGGMVAPSDPGFLTRLHPYYEDVEDPIAKPYCVYNVSQN